jgi:hypothetical protein
MFYLDPTTIQVFLYFLHNNKKPLTLFKFEAEDRINLIQDLEKNNMEDLFYFKFYPLIRYHGDEIENWYQIEKGLRKNYRNEKRLHVFKTIKDNVKDKIFKVSDLACFNDDFLYPSSDVIRLFEMYFNRSKSDEIFDFMNRYLFNFRNDELLSDENYYSFNKSYSIVLNRLKEAYEKYGKIFIIEPVELLQSDDIEVYTQFDRKNRFYDILFYLFIQGYIGINFLDFKLFIVSNDSPKGQEHKLNLLRLSVTMHKSPAEISDIEKYWAHYGDIRINEADGVAYYKNNRYPFKSTRGRVFRLLCFLIKNHGNKIPLERAYHAIIEEDDLENVGDKQKPKIMKKYIKDYVKKIKENLKISEDKNPTIDIMVIKDSVMLISNPPINN